MIASTYRRGMLSNLPYKVFSGPLDEDVDIQFHASYINKIVFYGAEKIEVSYKRLWILKILFFNWQSEYLT